MNPETEAGTLLSELGIEQLPICPSSICAMLGVHIQNVDLQGIDGAIVSTNGIVGIILNSNVKSISRQRFTVAHELGHYAMDLIRNPLVLCQNVEIDLDGNTSPEIERRADLFAAALLMPYSQIKKYLSEEPSWEAVKQISETCQVSLQAAAFRYTSKNKHKLCFVYLKDGYVKWFKKSEDCHYFIPILYKPKDVSKYGDRDWVEVNATRWFADTKSVFGRTILECALPISSDGFQLVMLWDEYGDDVGWDEEDD
jgi:hypothetical protein